MCFVATCVFYISSIVISWKWTELPEIVYMVVSFVFAFSLEQPTNNLNMLVYLQ